MLDRPPAKGIQSLHPSLTVRRGKIDSKEMGLGVRRCSPVPPNVSPDQEAYDFARSLSIAGQMYAGGDLN
jgi:hypothetical protein